jgi:ubiquinone/menaquinone biosynthesis C-methylase UbiE
MSKDTIWDRFLKPLFSTFLLNKEQIEQTQKAIDWEEETQELKDPSISYPQYYKSQNFHGIAGGYLTSAAAVTYDPITQYVLPPNETIVRQAFLDKIVGYPKKIIDLGCGTGSGTLALKKLFPDSQVMGIDLSPYMLALARYKAKEQHLIIDWRHGIAESTTLANNSVNLVTISLLFHELPTKIIKSVLDEVFRLLTPGGQVLILDGNQKVINRASWLANVFEEPYIKEYAQGNLDFWLVSVGFGEIKTDDIWLIHQITRAVKPG